MTNLGGFQKRFSVLDVTKISPKIDALIHAIMDEINLNFIEITKICLFSANKAYFNLLYLSQYKEKYVSKRGSLLFQM